MRTTFSLITPDIRRLARKYAGEGRLLNPMSDTVFKSLFGGGGEDSRQALRLLLCACTGRAVVSVKVLNSELLPEHLGAKTVRLDVYASFNDGDKADLEMQLTLGSDDFKKRAAFNAARLLSSQGRGKKYRDIKRVYQISFINGILFPGDSRIPRRYFLMEEQNHDILTQAVEVIFYELPKLEAKVRAHREGGKTPYAFSEEEKWCIYLKYRHEERASDLIAELCRKEEGMMRAEAALRRVSRSEEQWARQLFREKAEMDYRSEIETARDAAHDAGWNAGNARGFERARLKYEAKYRQAMLEIARKMKAKGWPLEEIAGDTGIALEIIAKL